MSVRDLGLAVVYRDVGSLKPARRNARQHSPKQITQIAASIQQFGFVSPILTDKDGAVIAGHGRLAAAAQLGLAQVPTIALEHLSPEQRRAYALADNRLAELAEWDEELLAIELQELGALDLGFDLEIIGFEGAELDAILSPYAADGELDPVADQIPEAQGPAVTHPGDVWILGQHRLACADARLPESYALLMPGETARMAFTDPPYNVPIAGHAGGKGKVARRDFVMAAGEMTKAEFTAFLTESHKAMAGVLMDGAISYTCMDWRHMGEMLDALEGAGLSLKNLAVWSKTNAGMGSFYRSQHELVFVAKHGREPHVNTFGLGEKGRYRTNVWTYPGANTFRAGRDADLALHPTVKPVALVADAIKDVSRRGDIVLDPFGGSGTTLIAAEKTGRRARLLELDPLYADAIVRRFAFVTGQTAVLEATGQSFIKVADERVMNGGTPE